MPFARPNIRQLIQKGRDYISSRLPGYATLLDSDPLAVLADNNAGLVVGLYDYEDYIAKQSIPFTATDEYLHAWAGLKNVIRKTASFASGPVVFTGSIDQVIDAGTIILRSDGFQYTLDSSVAIIGATGSGSLTAVQAGATGNVTVSSSMNLQSINASIISITAFPQDGEDLEGDVSLRARMLQAWALTPMGGSSNDYKVWAEEYPGVTVAWCDSSVTYGAGTVVVFALIDNAPLVGTDGVSPTYEYRDPSHIASGNQGAIADYLYSLQQVTALVYVVSPTLYPLDLTIQQASTFSTQQRDDVSSAISAQLLEISSPLGMSVFSNEISNAINTVSGLPNYSLVFTSAGIPVGSIPSLGVITWA